MNIDSVDTLVTHNRDHLRRMRELNLRAGKEVFPVPNHDDMQSHFISGLKVARCASEISDWNALRLPSLDQAKIDSVLTSSPDTIMVLGVTVSVGYTDGCGGTVPHPFIKLPQELVRSQLWHKLPDEGIYLPNERKVLICFYPDGYSDHLAETDIPTLKAKARDSLNKGQWNRWQRPNLSSPTVAIAPLVERQYGQCVITQEPLIAYGTIRPGFGSSWYTEWTRDQSEAERLHEDACRRFEHLQEEVRRVEFLKRARELYQVYYIALSTELRFELREVLFGFAQYSRADIETLVFKVEAVVKPQTNTTEPGKVDLSQLFGGGVRVKR